MSDLRSRRRHEVAEHGRRDLLLVGIEGSEGHVQMRANNSLGATESLEGLQPEHA